jgi:hypothetical protein
LLHQFLIEGTDENDHPNFPLRQIGQFGGQGVIPATCKSVFNCHIAAFGIANVSKATSTEASIEASESAILLLRYPITGIARCCACAASGQTAAPPSPAMNSRR